jgi:hypothetical protein
MVQGGHLIHKYPVKIWVDKHKYIHVEGEKEGASLRIKHIHVYEKALRHPQSSSFYLQYFPYALHNSNTNSPPASADVHTSL